MVPVCVHGVCEHVCVVSTSVCVCVILCVHRVCVFVSACMCDVSVCIHVEERCAGGQRNRNEGKDGRKPKTIFPLSELMSPMGPGRFLRLEISHEESQTQHCPD